MLRTLNNAKSISEFIEIEDNKRELIQDSIVKDFVKENKVLIHNIMVTL